MEISDVKAWLQRGWRINEEIARLELSATNLRCRAASVTPQYGGDAVAGTKDPHKMDNYLEAVERYAELVRERIDNLSRVSGEIVRVIYRVRDNRERAVLIDRYLNFLTWEQIAVKASYSYMQVTRIHGRALQSVRAILESTKDVIEC